MKRAKLELADFHFHDIRSVVAGIAENPVDHLGHIDPRTTRRVYQQNVLVMTPLPYAVFHVEGHPITTVGLGAENQLLLGGSW